MNDTLRQPPGRQRLVLAVVTLSAAALLATPLAHAEETQPSTQTRIDLPAAGEILWTKIVVRAKPSKTARVIRVMNQFRPDYRRQYVLATREVVDRRGRLWYRITLPGRPNGRSGWVSGYGLSLKPMRREIRIDRSARRLELWQGDERLVNTRIAVGARGMETPLGLFYVTWKFVPTAPILGAFAFETSAYSRLSDWPGGGIVGIHGTPWPWLLGQAVSHGCVRVHNIAINKLRRLVPVGTPIRIVA